MCLPSSRKSLPLHLDFIYKPLTFNLISNQKYYGRNISLQYCRKALGIWVLKPSKKLNCCVDPEPKTSSKNSRTVSTIEAVLLDAEQKRSTNHQVQDWLRKLEVELYEADDLNDDLSTQVLRHSLIHNKKNMAANKQGDRFAARYDDDDCQLRIMSYELFHFSIATNMLEYNISNRHGVMWSLCL